MLFTVPVRDRKGDIQTARMFMRIGFVGAGKTPLAMPDLPVAAPAFEGRGMSTVTYPIPMTQIEAGRG
jgi:type VI secretion system protein ImpL